MHFPASNEAQRINAMHSQISQRPAGCHTSIVDPLSRAAQHGSKEVGARHHRPSDGTSGHMLAENFHVLLKAHHMCHAKQNFRRMCSLYHLSRLLRIHGHRFLAEYRLAMVDGFQHVVAMQSIWTGNEYCIDLWTGTELGSGCEGVFDFKLPRRFLCLL